MDIALIVTGDAEFGGLAGSLDRAFPGHKFKCLPRKMNGFTSSALQDDSPLLFRTLKKGERIDTEISLLADTLITLADPGRNNRPADIVVLVEDLELANRHQPGRVVHWLREAVQTRIDVHFSTQARREKARERVRERCSFHLLVPMLESHFYSDANALNAAGRLRLSRFDHKVYDPEDFSVDDAEYLETPVTFGKGSRDWRNRPAENRRIHPKAYLEYLCTPAEHNAGADGTNGEKVAVPKTTYDERKAVDVLKSLSWPLAVQRLDASRYLRSLLADLAETLNPHPSIKPLIEHQHCAPLTFSADPSKRILRNL